MQRGASTVSKVVRRAPLARATRNAAVAYEVTVNGANLIGAGMAASGVGVPAIGVAMCFSSYMLAAARQPNMSAKLLPYCILGFALSEALALFTLLIALLELFVFS
jgi:F-type H+-transporting ATPase subunit c